MTVEAATYINTLDPTYPAATDAKSEGDDHLRLIKTAVKSTFPNVTGAVTPTHTELNYVDGVTSAIQTQLDAEATARANADTAEATARTNADALKANLASPALTGTPTAPTASVGTGTTQIATTAFVAATAFSTALPSQTGNAGKFVTTDGANASFADPFNAATEVATVSATAATGTIAYDITTQSVLYYTSNASANWAVNFRGSSGTSLDTLMATGESMTVAFLVTQGATAYYNSAVQVDGTTSGVTTRWLGGAPTAGNASGIDSYRYLIIKTGSATFTVLASNTQFKA